MRYVLAVPFALALVLPIYVHGDFLNRRSLSSLNAIRGKSQEQLQLSSEYALKNSAPEIITLLASLDERNREDAMQELLADELSAECRQDLNAGLGLMILSLLRGEIPQIGLLHMMDSWGKFPSGILSGHVQSPGDFHECIQARVNYTSVNSTEVRKFRGSYCSSYIVPAALLAPPPNETDGTTTLPPRHQRDAAESVQEFVDLILEASSIPMIPMVGSCLPSTCTFEDQELFLKRVVGLLSAGLAGPLVMDCRTGEKPEIGGRTTAVIVSLAIIVAMCVIGTVVDVFLIRRRKEEDRKDLSTLVQVFYSFSVYDNAQKVLNTSAGKRSLGCINGLRSITMFWVVLGHTFMMGAAQFNWNVVDAKKLYEKSWPIMVIINSSVSVDTFFVMSGLLVAYNMLRGLDKTKELKKFAMVEVPLMYIQRYLRLTPTYLILLGLAIGVYPYISNSPSWSYVEYEADVCAEKWWHNILYINNIVDNRENATMCYGESWYLANDFQFFLLSPFIVYPLWWSQWLGYAILGVLSLGTIFANCYIIETKDANPTFIAFVPDAVQSLEIYMKPWTRIGPYLVGIFVGYLIYKVGKSKPIKMPYWVVSLGWTLSTIAALGIVFGPYQWFNPGNKQAMKDSFVATLFGGLHRYVWGCSIGWIIYACVNGYGGIVNKFLCWEAFVPLGKLTYTVYIASYHIQFMYHAYLPVPVYFSVFLMIHVFLAHLLFNLMVGFFLTITIESPFVRLNSLLFRRS